jgi:DNA replication protein DnaC
MAGERFGSSAWDEGLYKAEDVVRSGGIISLIGGRGRGKTQIGVECIRLVTNLGQSAIYSRASEFFMELREAYKDGLKITERGVFEKFTKPHLLVLDECHERGFTDHENRALVLLIDKRYCDAKPTILIANMTPEEMRRNIGESIFDRLIETGGYIVCDWDSFRVKGA